MDLRSLRKEEEQFHSVLIRIFKIINPRAHPKARSLSLMDDLPAQPILEAPSRPNSPSLTHIFDLPEELIVNILSRLDSDHLARSRVVSKAFSDISTKVRSVNLLCSLDRYTNSGRLITPFKIIATDLILSKGDVISISIGVEERANHKSLDVKLDDLYLMEISFVDRWLRRVCGGLTSLSISDYRMHSHRKWSEVLSLISFHCNWRAAVQAANDDMNPPKSQRGQAAVSNDRRRAWSGGVWGRCTDRAWG